MKIFLVLMRSAARRQNPREWYELWSPSPLVKRRGRSLWKLEHKVAPKVTTNVVAVLLATIPQTPDGATLPVTAWVGWLVHITSSTRTIAATSHAKVRHAGYQQFPGPSIVRNQSRHLASYQHIQLPATAVNGAFASSAWVPATRM